MESVHCGRKGLYIKIQLRYSMNKNHAWLEKHFKKLNIGITKIKVAWKNILKSKHKYLKIKLTRKKFLKN